MESFQFKYIDSYNFEYKDDIVRIMSVLLDNGIFIHPKDAESVWLGYSRMYCAGWLFLPTSDIELYDILESCLLK